MTALPSTLLHAVRNPAVSKGVSLKVYAELHETLTIAEFRAVKAWYIADLLKVDRSAVQYALTDLVDRGYLERGDMLGNCFTFRITTPNNRSHTPPPARAA